RRQNPAPRPRRRAARRARRAGARGGCRQGGARHGPRHRGGPGRCLRGRPRDRPARGRRTLPPGDRGRDRSASGTRRRGRSGGGLARQAARAGGLWTLVLSDVVGDDPATIASGPTVGDPSTFRDAAAVLARYLAPEDVPVAVRAHLERGAAGAAPETVKPGDSALARAATVVVGGNHEAVAAAAAAAA